MSLIAIATTAFVVALSGALSPGPLLATTVSRSIVYGARQGPLLIAGHAILELLMVILLIVGLGPYLKQSMVSKVISIVGGFMLVFMAIKTLKTPVVFQARENTEVSTGLTVFSGALVSLSNPYWAIWWATIGLAYLAIALPRGFSGILAFFLGHISADFFWYSFVSFSVSKGKTKISPVFFGIIIGICGVFLLGFGIFLIVKAFI